MNTLEDLAQENKELRNGINLLEAELQFLRTHPTILQGIKGETLLATLTGGAISKYAESHDISLPGKATIEVEFSKLNTPVKCAKTRCWNWSKILGWKDKGKDFDFMLLIGEKDPRYLDQYIDSSPEPKPYPARFCRTGEIRRVTKRGGKPPYPRRPE